jgi:hypothetical protein
MTINFFFSLSLSPYFEMKKRKKTPLFEQDSGVYMSIFFHDMIDERQNQRASCVYIRFAIEAQR